jgi:protein SCO1/2
MLLLAMSLAGCAQREALPFYRTAEMTPEWLTAREAGARSMHHVAPFRMVDQRGAEVTERAFDGKATVVGFFFTRCGDICPTTTSNMRRLLALVPDEPRIQVLSHSVMPGQDSVAELRRFAEHHRISDPRWHLLTGVEAATEALAQESYFIPLGRDRRVGVSKSAHTESVMLVDTHGRLRGVYAAMLPVEMDRLQEDLALLLTEQAAASSR